MTSDQLEADATRARAAGDVERLVEIARVELSSNSDNLRALVDVAIYLRDLGVSDVSDTVLHYIINKDPQSAYGHFELAVSCLLRGSHLEGIKVLDRMLAIFPTDPRAIILRARLLCGIGASELAVMQLQDARGLVPPDESVLVEQFAAYIKQLPCMKAIYFASRAPLESAVHIKGLIEDALERKIGFSLVRFGDGEGVFFKPSDEEENILRAFYRHARRDRARVWFGDTYPAIEESFTAQAVQIGAVFDSCDVAGVPYRSWIEHEYRILSYSGILGLGNIARHLATSRAPPVAASQMIHLDLAESGALRSILRKRNFCGIISCFAEVPDLLRSEFEIAEVDFIKVPGEKLFSDKIGAAAAVGQHFPEVFSHVMQRLSRPLNGRLYLVAAGLLGKFYCARIKQSGGVALDIGSLVDAALGKSTRPGYSASKRLTW